MHAHFPTPALIEHPQQKRSTERLLRLCNPNSKLSESARSVRKTPFADWPVFSTDEIEAVTRVLSSGKVNYWTGKDGHLFEKEFASFSECSHAIAVSSGSTALELALYALDVGPGDEVIVPCRTFIASASCVVLRGATPVFAGVDPVSQNVTSETIRPCITPRTKAIIVVHLAGWPCDMDPIRSLADEFGLKVIEDCAQCHGATYKGRPVGSLGDVAAFSFCQDKIMTTGGEGGMLTTNDENIWRMAWEFKDHGKSWEAVYNAPHPPGFRWVHETFGTNLRLTEMQSAIGRIQLQKLPQWIEIRRQNAAMLTEAFSKIPALRVTVPQPEFGHSYYKYYVFVRPEFLRPGWNRDHIMAEINREGIPCFYGSCSEVYLEKAFVSAGIGPGERFEVARNLGETSLMFLVHPTLNAADMADTCKAITKVFAHAAA